MDEPEFLKHYKDRGMMKWAGFFLSEHTAELEQIKKVESRFNPQKELLDFEEIGAVISSALVKSRKVAVQLEAVDPNGFYYDDIIGFIQGADEHGIFVGGARINFENIRNIEFYQEDKWSHITNK